MSGAAPAFNQLGSAARGVGLTVALLFVLGRGLYRRRARRRAKMRPEPDERPRPNPFGEP